MNQTEIEEGEICINDYVRTKSGIIAKIKNKYDEEYEERGNIIYELDKEVYDDIDEETSIYALPDQFKSHDKDIINLVEEGDYVNGKKIEAIIDGLIKSEGVAERVLCFEIDFPIENGLRAYHNCDIKTIVTHEQFKSIEYKVGG